jgi:hypothetical protein
MSLRSLSLLNSVLARAKHRCNARFIPDVGVFHPRPKDCGSLFAQYRRTLYLHSFVYTHHFVDKAISNEAPHRSGWHMDVSGFIGWSPGYRETSARYSFQDYRNHTQSRITTTMEQGEASGCFRDGISH